MAGEENSLRLSDVLAMEPASQDGEPETFRLGDVAALEPVESPELSAEPIFEVDDLKKEEWKARGPIGFVEAWRRADKTELLPFNPEGSFKAVGLLRSVQRLQSGEGDPAQIEKDRDTVARYLEGVEEERVRGYAKWKGIPTGRIGQGTTHLPGFMFEFLATGGLATLGKKATTAAAQKVAKDAIERGVLKYTTKAAGVTAGATLRTAAMPHRVVENFAERQTRASLDLTEKGVQLAKEVQERPYTSAMKAFGDVLIENFSEATGPAIAAVGRRAVPAALHASLSQLWARFHPGESVTKLFTQAGFHGFLTELGEERVGNLLRAMTGVEDFGAENPDRVFDRIIASIPSGDELLVEAGVLAFPGAVQLGTSQAVSLLRKRKEGAKVADPPIRPITEAEADAIAQPPVEDGGEIELEDSVPPDVLDEMDVAAAFESAGVDPDSIGDAVEAHSEAVAAGQEPGEAVTAIADNFRTVPAFDDFYEAREPQDRQLIIEAEEQIVDAPSTKSQFSNKRGTYTRERRAEHDKIIADPKYNKTSAVTKPGEKPKAIIVIGPPAAGKSTMLKTHYADLERDAVQLDNDEIKERLPNFKPVLAGNFHEESSDIERRILEELVVRQMNFITPRLGKGTESLRQMIRLLKENNYEVEMVLVDLAPEKAAERALERYRDKGGRYVSPRYILEEVGLKSVATYNKLKAEVDKYARFNSDVPRGEAPRLVEKTDRPGQDPDGRDLGSAQERDASAERASQTPTEEVALETSSSVGTEGVSLPKSTVRKEARRLRSEQITEPAALESFVLDNGGIRPFQKNAEGRRPEMEEYRAIPRRFRSGRGRPLDEMADNAVAAGLLPPDATAEDLRQALIEFGDRRRPPTIASFEPEGEELARMKRADFARVQPGIRSEARAATGQTRQTEPPTVTEYQALRESIRAQARGALEGFRAGRQDVQGIKKAIAAELRRLPKREQGFLSGTLVNAKTQKDVAKAIAKIDQRLEQFQKREAINRLKRELQRLEASPSVAVDFKQKIRALVSGVLLNKPRGETLQRLVEMREFVEAQRTAGAIVEGLFPNQPRDADVDVPARVLETLRALSARPLADMRLAEIEDIRAEVRTLADLGKTKLRVRKEIDRLRKERDLDDLLAGSVPLESQAVKVPVRPGERLNLGQRMENKWAETVNFVQNADIAITPIDAIIDHLDGDAMYQGPNFRIFKSRVDTGFANYLDLRDGYRDEITAASAGLRQSNFERIGVFAIAQQEGGMEKLANNGLTAADIPTLSPKELEVYRFMRQQLDRARPLVSEVMKRVYNVEMGQVRNYFPFMTNWELMAEQKVNDRLVTELIGLRKNVEQGFTKARVGTGDQRVEIDALDVYMKHMDDVAYLITLGEDIKYLGELAATSDYRDAVGDAGQEMMREWIDVLAKKGGSHGTPTMAVLDSLRRNLGAATFAFKVGSAVIQVTSIGHGAALIGPHAFKGAYDLTSRRWRDFVMDNMPELRNRIGDDIAFREFRDRTAIEKLVETGLYPMKALDGLAAGSVAIGAYQKYLSDNGLEMDFANPNPEAIEYAQRIVRRSQSSGFFKDAPLALTRGKLTGNKSIDRAIFQFQSFALTEWSVIRHELWDAGVRKGNVAQSANIVFWLLLTSAAEQSLRRLMKDLLTDSDEEDPFLRDYILELIGKVPFVGQLMGAAMYDSNPVPVVNFLSSGARGLNSFVTGKSARTRLRGAIRIAGSAARAAGLPGTAQAEQLLMKAFPQNRGGGRSL